MHRDVKPANIMLDDKGEPMLMDFGLARIRAAEEKLTHDGTVLGTPAYMSPEQARGQSDQVGPPVTSTVWACCCTSCSGRAALQRPAGAGDRVGHQPGAPPSLS